MPGDLVALPMISSPTVDLIKWSGLAVLAALVATSLYVSGNVGAFYWKLLVVTLLTLAAFGMGIRAFVRPPKCLTCDRDLPRDALSCPHCAAAER